MLQPALTPQAFPQAPNSLINLVKPNTQKIKTSEEKNDDPKYDFLFNIMQGYSLKLSEINSLNCKRLSEFDQNIINTIKKIDDKINRSHKTVIDIKAENEALKTLLQDKTEELLRSCVLGTKNVHLRVQTLRKLFDAINQEFDAYASIVRSFEDQISRIKNDTRQVYHIPSKTLVTIVSVIQKKIKALQMSVEDLTQIADTHAEADVKEELDNIKRHRIMLSSNP